MKDSSIHDMEDFIKEFIERKRKIWELVYYQDNEIRTTYYQADRLVDAVNWLHDITQGAAFIVGAGIPDDEED